MGHRILALVTGGYVNDCTATRSANLPCYTASSHAIDSAENQSCAAMEGFAHFVAVRAFNDHQDGDNPGAVLQYWRDSGLTVNVEQGPDGGVDKYYEAVCGGNAQNAAGSGVELDWMRTWWDYHTNTTVGFKPDQTVMMDEIAENGNWTSQNTYSFISDGIESSSGSDQRDRWDAISQANGIDH
jgi:hypothetical protein